MNIQFIEEMKRDIKPIVLPSNKHLKYLPKIRQSSTLGGWGRQPWRETKSVSHCIQMITLRQISSGSYVFWPRHRALSREYSWMKGPTGQIPFLRKAKREEVKRWPRSFSASVVNCSMLSPRFVVEENCQLSTSATWSQVPIGGLVKKFTFYWK